MASLRKKPKLIAYFLLVPFLTVASPSWLGIAGVRPCWAILWLLPWSLLDGPLSGLVAGLCLGLLLDSLTIGTATHLPALMLLGWWWGRIGKSGPRIERSFNLGFLAWIGSVVIGLSLFLQTYFLYFESSLEWLNSWGLHTILSESIGTALLAPVVSSLLLLVWCRNS